MARAGMTNLIAELRRMTSTTTDDYSDDQLQAFLDKERSTYKQLEVTPLDDYAAGAYTYSEYPFPQGLRWVEENQTGSGWALRDVAGAAAPAYTVNYDAAMITFTVANTHGNSYFLDCRMYNLNRAAAKIWREKAAATLMPDWKTDNHEVKASQEYAMCIRMAEEYEAREGMQIADLYRGDMW